MQFSETFEVKPVAGPPRESPPPTLPWRVTLGSAAARFAGCSNPRIKPTASSNRCRPCRAVGKYGPSGPNAIVGKSHGLSVVAGILRSEQKAELVGEPSKAELRREASFVLFVLHTLCARSDRLRLDFSWRALPVSNRIEGRGARTSCAGSCQILLTALGCTPIAVSRRDALATSLVY